MQNYSFQIRPTKAPDFHILWMFIISKEYSIAYNNQLYTVKIKVYNIFLILKNINKAKVVKSWKEMKSNAKKK